jgi:hypothetical protein
MEAAGASPYVLHFWRHLLWLKDESLEDSANIPLHCHPEFPASLDTLKVSMPLGVKLAAPNVRGQRSIPT